MMSWYSGVAYFFGGLFLANAIPHLVSGVSGRPLQSPFAWPPFKGLSSPAVNVTWGLFNLAAAYLLLLHIGEFDIRSWLHALCFAGFGTMAFQCARSLGRIYRECPDKPASRSTIDT
jgi:hypothetical protein